MRVAVRHGVGRNFVSGQGNAGMPSMACDGGGQFVMRVWTWYGSDVWDIINPLLAPAMLAAPLAVLAAEALGLPTEARLHLPDHGAGPIGLVQSCSPQAPGMSCGEG